MFIRMLKLPEEVRARYDLSSLQVVVHAAAPCPAEVKAQIIDWFGPIIHEYYAGTEGNGFVYCNSEDWLAHRGTVGKADPRCRPHRRRRRRGGAHRRVGHRLLRGRARPRRSSTTTTPRRRPSSRDPKGRGWSTLGDVGYLDDDGFLYLTDRKAYMIITGGVNVYPQEAENVLALHPKVNDVAVFGVPNDDFGEEVKAVVEPASMDDAGPGPRAGAHRVLQGAPGRRQVPALGRLPRRAPAPPHRQALQAPAEGRVLGGRRPVHLGAGARQRRLPVPGLAGPARVRAPRRRERGAREHDAGVRARGAASATATSRPTCTSPPTAC